MTRYEQPTYTVVKTGTDYEVRDYESHLVAETKVEGDFDSTGNVAFRRLAGFIFGNNSERKKMNMTVPVVHRVGDGVHRYQFMMEGAYDEHTLPRPIDDTIEIKRLAAGRYAALRYRGGRGEDRYVRAADRLLAALARDEVTVIGEPFGAVYNGPATPPIMRRNEVLVEVV